MMAGHATNVDHEASATQRGWLTLSDEAKVAVLIDIIDETRLDCHGGYPSQYVIHNGTVYWATMDAAKEYNAPELVVRPIDKFIDEYEDMVADDWEE
jgi:hypothetical protein